MTDSSGTSGQIMSSLPVNGVTPALQRLVTGAARAAFAGCRLAGRPAPGRTASSRTSRRARDCCALPELRAVLAVDEEFLPAEVHAALTLTLSPLSAMSHAFPRAASSKARLTATRASCTL